MMYVSRNVLLRAKGLIRVRYFAVDIATGENFVKTKKAHTPYKVCKLLDAYVKYVLCYSIVC